MKDTKDNQTEEPREKINFQSFRKCMFNDYCCINSRKCVIDLLYDEFIRLYLKNRKFDR